MVDIRISSRNINITDGIRDCVNQKIGDALKVFDIAPMSCDVVIRIGKNRSNLDRKTVEVTVFVRDNVVRVETSGDDIYAAIDEAANKVTRQMRKYKTRIVDRRQRTPMPAVSTEPVKDLADLIEPSADEAEEEELLVREKFIELTPMTEEEALVQTDLIGHDFYVFINKATGLVNVVYHRQDGGYGIIKPKN